MIKPVIAVAETAFPDRASLEKDFGHRAELRWIDVSSPGSIQESTSRAGAVVVTLQRLSADVITAFAPSVRVIGRAGVGLDTIDLAAARDRGIAVFNQPAYGAPEVASHALALLLALERRLWPADAYVRAGWRGRPSLGRIRALDDSTVGVLGAGRTGRAFVDRVQPLVREVVVYDPEPVSLPSGVTRAASVDELLGRTEMLSLHLPLTPQTRGLIGRRELGLLPPGAIVVNVSRGGIIDEDALAALLHDGHLGGAALDVFETEPLPATSPLLSAPNTVVGKALAAADRLAGEGIEAEVIDLRTLMPLDLDLVEESVRRTRVLVVAAEDYRHGGIGAEIAASLQESLFSELDAPVRRLGARSRRCRTARCCSTP